METGAGLFVSYPPIGLGFTALPGAGSREPHRVQRFINP
jgi:hypothetical protein